MKKDIKKYNSNASNNNKGFTLIEIIAVVTIIGLLVVISGIAVTEYIEDSKTKTYESYKKDLAVASENYLINCMTNNEEGCSIPDYGNDLRLNYNELVEYGYTKELKDPEGDGYCDTSYVIAKNNSTNGVDIEYQVCLFCSKYKSTDGDCQEVRTDDLTPPTCGDTKGESTEWSKENKVITVGCKDTGIGCKKNEFSSSIGKEGEVIKETSITIQDKAGNKTTCPVAAYVDKKDPTCKIELDETSTSGWYKKGVTARITQIEDEGSGVAASGMGTSLVNRNYNGKSSFQVTGGIVTVFGYVKDKVGNEGYCSKEVKVDNTNPSGTIYMGYEVHPKENYAIDGTNLTIYNLSKYEEVEGLIIYFKNNVTSSVKSNVYNENGTNVMISGGVTAGNNKAIIKITEGTYDRLRINIGNSSYIKQIAKVEVIKKENETSIWTNKDVSVYVEAKDTITGVGSYSYDGGNTYISSNVNSYGSNTSNSVVIKDRAGNISKKYDFIINKIDKVAPTLTVNAYKCSATSCTSPIGNVVESSSTNDDTITIDWTNLAGYFEYVANDANYNYVEWNWNAAGNYKKTEVLSTNSSIKEDSQGEVTLTSEGYRVGKLTAYDKAGNSTTINVEIKIDKTPPSLTITNPTNEEWTNKGFSLTLNGSDNLSGIRDYAYSYDETVYNTYANSATNSFTTTPFETERNQLAYIRVCDQANNCKVDNTYIRIDKTSPSIPTSVIRYTSSTGTVRENTDDWTNQTLWWGNFSSSDGGGADIDHYEYSSGCTGTKTGNLVSSYQYSTNIDYKFCIRAVDTAGNISSWSSPYYFRIDKTPPYIVYSFDNMTLTQKDSSGAVVSGAYLKQGLTCNSNSCSGAVICLNDVEGNFNVDNYDVLFKDDLSGYSSRTANDTMYNISGQETEDSGCLRTRGDNPCIWKWNYTVYDKAGNSATGEVNFDVDYIGYGSCKQ